MANINCSVTVMLVYKGKIGFLRREGSDTYGHLLVAPGGKVEVSDGVLIEGVPYHSLEYAAIREVREETGLGIDAPEYFCSLTLPTGRVVVSFYYRMQFAQGAFNCNLEWLDKTEIESRDDFALGMKTEALLLCRKLEDIRKHEQR